MCGFYGFLQDMQEGTITIGRITCKHYRHGLYLKDKWLTLLLHKWEVPGSNLGPETNYNEIFMVFLSPSRQLPKYYVKLGHDHFLPHPLQFIINN
jgi:hypothetical protein